MAKKIARKKDSNFSGSMVSAGLEHNVDRIREILFGTAMKDYEERFELVQAQLDELAGRLDGALKDAVESAKQQVTGLQNSLEEVVRDLTGQVRDTLRGQEKLQVNLEKMLQQSLKESLTLIRKEVQQNHAELVGAIDEIRQNQTEQIEDLSTRKMDRQELVRLFMEFINAHAGR